MYMTVRGKALLCTCSGRAVIHCFSMSTRSSRSYSVAVAHQTSGISSMPSHWAMVGKQRSSSVLVRPVSHGAPSRSRRIGRIVYGAVHPANPPVAVCIARVRGEVAIS